MRRRKSIINIYYIPALLLFGFFVVYPFLSGISVSFTNWNGYSQTSKYVGWENYVSFFQDAHVKTAFINTIIYGFGSTLLQNIFGLAYALLLNRKFFGRSATRAVVYMQAMVAPLVMGYMYYFILRYDKGALNDIMKLLGNTPIDWLGDGPRAVLLMTLINSIQFMGVAMVIYLAGLQNISTMYYEAAEIDGANSVQKFRYVTFPLLIPACTSAVMLNLIGGLKLYDVIAALTNGGPGFASHSLSTLISQTYFRGENAGYAATIGIFTFLFIMTVSILFMRFFDKKEVYT